VFGLGRTLKSQTAVLPFSREPPAIMHGQHVVAAKFPPAAIKASARKFGVNISDLEYQPENFSPKVSARES